MISSGFIWGAVLDTLGRRKPLLIGFVIQTLIVFGKSLAQEFYVLSALGFLGGTMSGGLYIAINTYLQEFQSTEYRARIQMIFGMMFSGVNIVIPLLSSAILPLKFHVQLSFLDFYAWNLLILLTSTSSIISAICFCFLPESPKFLMSSGKNVEAMEVFKTIFKYNSGKPKELYPIDCLIQEIEDNKDLTTNRKSRLRYIKSWWQQMTPLFQRKYGPKLILVAIVQSSFQMTFDTIRFYMPQIFQATHDFEVVNNGTFPTNICMVLEILRAPKPNDEEYVCLVNLENNFNVYLNSIIIAIIALISYGLVGTLINIFGKKRVIVTLGFTASVSICCMFLSNSPLTTLALSALYLTSCGICFDLFITVIMVSFPTTLRAMAISICMLLGRSLGVAGNMIFPILVETGCSPPFLAIGSLVLVAVLLVCILPNTDKVDMK